TGSPALHLRIRRLQPPRDGIDLRLRSIDGDAGFEAPVDSYRRDAAYPARGAASDRNIEVRAPASKTESARQHAVDRHHLAIEIPTAADDSRVGCEAALPQFIVEDPYWRRAWLVFRGQEIPAGDRRDAEYGKVAGVHAETVRSLRAGYREEGGRGQCVGH